MVFHCLLRPSEARAVEWVDMIFDDIWASRYEGVLVVVSVSLPNTRCESVHSQLQHVLVDCQSSALLLRWEQLRAAHGGSCRVLNCSASEHAIGLRQASRNMASTVTTRPSQVFEEAEQPTIGCGCHRFAGQTQTARCGLHVNISSDAKVAWWERCNSGR